MHQFLRFAFFIIALTSFFRIGTSQTIDTIFGCDEIPNSPLAGASCTICNFDILYGSTFPFTASDPAGWCGTIENDQYIGFVAGPTGSVVFEMTTFNCVNSNGVQVGIYDSNNSLVGDCLGQVFPNMPEIFTAGGLNPGEVYYMRIDGFAGDGCEFNIRVISGLISMGPDAPGPIMGPEFVCFDERYPYFIAPVANATAYYWRLTPGVFTAGATIDPPEAGNPLTGTTSLNIEVEIPEMSIAHPPGFCDVIRLDVFPLNPCFASADSSSFDIQVCRPTQDTTYADLCIGQEVEFPPGSGNFFDTPFVFETVDVGPGPRGCDSFAVLFLDIIPGAISDLENVVLCEGEVADLCGFPDPSIIAGPSSCTLPGAAANGCDSIVVFFVTFLDPEAHIEAETGAISCTNLEETLFAVTRTGSIPPSSSGDTISYVWTDASMTVIGTGENVDVTEPGTYTLTVNMTSDLDPSKVCSESVDITINDDRTAPNPPAINGNDNVCINDVPEQYTATGAMGSDQYFWTVTPDPGVTFTTGTDDLTVTDWGTATSAIICVSTFNSCDTSAATCLPITILQLPTAATLPAMDTLCEGDAATYAIGGFDSDFTYTISSNPAGSSATVNGSDIDFTMGSASGQVCLEVSNQCETLDPVCIDVVLRLPPVAVAPTGPADVCIGDTVDYVLYTTLPTGTTASVVVTGGDIVTQSGNMATVAWDTPGTGDVCVTYTNVCGSDEACLDVDVSTAGDAVMSGGGNYCEGNNDLEIMITFTGAGPYDYSYLFGTTTITGSSTTSPVIISAPAPGTYVLTGFSVGACSGTVSGSAMVAEDPTPTATISGGGNICPGDDATITIDFTGDAPWTYEIALDGAGQGSNTTSDNPFTTTVSVEGDYTLVSVESDAGCVGTVSGTAEVRELDSPVADPETFVCSLDGLTYTISFDITGGDAASYMVAPAGSGTLSGTTFTSNPIPSGDSYTFTVSDANNCQTSVVTGSQMCPCLTEIGDLDNTAIDICDDGMATDFSVEYDDTNEFQDINDTRVYTLHTDAGTTITGAIATNTTGMFAFDPASMTYGTTYYISVVVGDDDGAGGVDLTNACTLVAAGVPATWYPIPTADLVGGGDVCVGADSTVVVTFTGVGPWTIGYDVGPDAFTQTTSDNPYTIDLTNLQNDVTVTLTSVTTANCPGTATGSADFVVHDEVRVTADAVCNGTSTEFTVTINISGGDPSSYTVVPNTGTLVGNVFTSDPIPAGSGYSFSVSDQWGCNTAVAAEPQVICNCISDAGTMDQTQITVCGPQDITVVIPVDTMMDSDDAINFVLHDGTGNAIGPNLITQQAGTTFSFVPGSTQFGVVYYISAIMGSATGGVVDLTDPCLDVAVGTPVLWLEEPTATLSGGGDFCVGDQIDLTFDITSTGPVIVEYTDGTTVFTVNLSAGNNVVPAPLDSTATYTIVSVTEGPCTGTVNGTAVVVVHDEVSVVMDTRCNSTSTEFRVTITISGGDPSTYAVSPNTGTLVGNVFTSDPIPAGGGYSFSVSDQWNCNTAVAAEPVVNCDCISDAGTMDQAQITVCGPNDITVVIPVDTMMDGDDAINFVLHDGTGNAIGPNLITQQAGTTFSFVPGATQYGVVYYISAIMGNAPGGVVDLADPCLDVAVGTPVLWLEEPTVTLSGDGDYCIGDQIDLTFDVTSAGPVDVVYSDGTTDYTVTLNPGTNTISAPLSTTAMYTIVSITEGPCSGTVNGSSASVVVRGAPVVGVSRMITFNSTFTEYQVTFTISQGDTATYTVDGVALGGATTFTSAPIACGLDYAFVINDQFNCGPTTITSPVNCNCQTAVGSLAGDLSTCDLNELTAPIYDATNENLDGDDAVEYLLYLADINTPVQRGATPTFAFIPASMTTGTIYSIVAVAGNATNGSVDFSDPCLSISPPVTAVWYDLPGVTATAPAAVCANDDWTVTINVTGSPDQKTVYYTFNGVPDSLLGVVPGTASTLTFTVMANTGISITGVGDDNCSDTANIDLDVNVASEIFVNAINDDNCDGTGTEYFVTFEITGGDPTSYVVTPAGSGTIVGSTFTSNAIPSGTVYDYQVSDASGCFTVPVNGNRRCDCTTDAGMMTSTALLMVCEGEDLAAGFSIGSEILDANDQLLFALRTSGDRLDYTDDLLALSTTPVFPFDPTLMSAGDTLYISPVAGDATGATIDTNDPCLSIGLATPIYIEFIPTGMLVGDTIICEGGTADITLVLTGNGPFDVTISQGDSGSDTTLTGINTGFIYQVDPATGTIFVMTNIAQSAIPGCSSSPNSRVTIDVDDLLTAGEEMAELVLCEGTGDVIELSDQISDEDVGGTWTQSSGPASGADFNASAGVVSNNNLAPGAYTFTYTVGSGAPCPQDAADVDVQIEAGPTVDAGPDQTLTCDLPVVSLGSSPIPGNTYRWEGGPVQDSTSSLTTTTSPGTYTLIVETGTAACEGRDMVVVESSGDLPAFDGLLVRDVTCFGDTDGAVFTGVDGGTGPFTYSLDGGTPQQSGRFPDLSPGVHEITVEDSEGCMSTESFVIENAKEVIVDPGPNLEIPFGSTQFIQLFLEGDIETITWQGDSVVCISQGPLCDSAMLTPQFSQTYLITARDSNGCTASAPLQLLVRRDRPVGVPTAFSPNGDGNNDVIFIFAQEGVLREINYFRIFDRWGEEVFFEENFQPNDPAFGWDGMLDGEFMNPAVFVFVAEVVFDDGTTDVIDGDFSLVK